MQHASTMVIYIYFDYFKLFSHAAKRISVKLVFTGVKSNYSGSHIIPLFTITLSRGPFLLVFSILMLQGDSGLVSPKKLGKYCFYRCKIRNNLQLDNGIM